jgi:hypothetical protein
MAPQLCLVKADAKPASAREHPTARLGHKGTALLLPGSIWVVLPQPHTRGRLHGYRRLVADPAWLETGGCLPGFPIDMGHVARVVHSPRSVQADSERAQRATLRCKTFYRFREPLRNNLNN